MVHQCRGLILGIKVGWLGLRVRSLLLYVGRVYSGLSGGVWYRRVQELTSVVSLRSQPGTGSRYIAVSVYCHTPYSHNTKDTKYMIILYSHSYPPLLHMIYLIGIRGIILMNR
jgi:hypothetical protein